MTTDVLNAARSQYQHCTDRELLVFTRESSYCFLARLSHRNSVRLSVRPSHGWISQKRCKLGSPNLHRRLPGRLYTVSQKTGPLLPFAITPTVLVQ